jgi:phosphatidate cytidylyltransferase
VLAQRVGSAVVALPVLLALIWWAPAWLFVAALAGLALQCQWELYRMYRAAGVGVATGPGLALGLLVVLAFAAGPSRSGLVVLALALAVAGTLVAGLAQPGEPAAIWPGVAVTLLGVLYCVFLLGHAVWLRALPAGPGLVLFVLLVTWCGESAAYFVGRRWGRRRLAPRTSPGKTVEGAAAQWVATVVAALLVAPWLTGGVMSSRQALVAAAVLGVVGQLGDLAESLLKRGAGTKDAGGILPGHGGLLDRVDSLLFNIAGLYHYVVLLRPTSS